MEHSCFCDMTTFLTDTWGISVNRISELSEGSAKCFIVDSKTGKYFFKVYQTKFDQSTLSNEIAVCDFLTKKGFSVSTFLPSKEFRYVEEFNGKLCTLQNYIDGITYRSFSAPTELLYDSARVLAKINIALEELPFQLPLGFEPSWFTEWTAERGIEKYNQLLSRLNCKDEHYDRIAKDFEAKCKLLSAFNATVFPFASLTSENTHGDYNVLQLIFSKNCVRAVVDFSGCSKIPICWELIRSYSLSSNECRQGVIDVNNFLNYLKEYLKIRRISKTDLELMPYFYLFTLIRSSFGYKGYIEKRSSGLPVDTKDKNTLEFAFWRTDMCKWLFSNADCISSAIKQSFC